MTTNTDGSQLDLKMQQKQWPEMIIHSAAQIAPLGEGSVVQHAGLGRVDVRSNNLMLATPNRTHRSAIALFSEALVDVDFMLGERPRERIPSV